MPMPAAMTKRERLDAAIASRPVDRLPVALWRHFFDREGSREGLVEAMRAWQTEYDWDFVKLNPRASYHVEDWGCRFDPSESPTLPPVLVSAAVHEPDDFRHLERLWPGHPEGEGLRSPVLESHLGAVGDLRKALGPDVPILMTVFTPMAIAAELAGGPQDLAALVAADATMVHVGLRTITDTFGHFAARCIDAGADGLFLATTHTAMTVNFTREQYEEFGRPYDLEVLDAVAHAPLNLLHVCGARAMVKDLADYPVALLNWDHAAEGNPALPDLRAVAPEAAVVGGLDRRALARPDAAAEVPARVRAARAAMDGRPWVLGSTCTLEPKTDAAAVAAVREAAETP